MYNSFFKLARNPFEISPDPHFLFPTAWHNEALAGLYYGIKARKGFMVLTGEVGTGKTLVVRCLLDSLDRSKITCSYVVNTLLSRREFLYYVAQDLGLEYRPVLKSDLLIQLNWHLLNRARQGLLTLLVVDEAQHLSTAVLEEVRLLTNLETRQGKLLQILLVGQPELDAKLESHELRQLKQRIVLRFQLSALPEQLTQGYIERRLELAGCNASGIFSLPAVQRIYAYSRGLPRLINILCDNAMVSAYAQGQCRITSKIVDEVASDLRLEGLSWDKSGLSLVSSGHPGLKDKEDRSRLSRPAPVCWPDSAGRAINSVLERG